MIVVYTTSHSKNARQWALTNCIQDEDNITLFHVTKTSIGQGNTHNLLYIFTQRLQLNLQLEGNHLDPSSMNNRSKNRSLGFRG